MKNKINLLVPGLLLSLSLYACPATTVVNPPSATPSSEQVQSSSVYNGTNDTAAPVSPAYTAPSATSMPSVYPTAQATASSAMPSGVSTGVNAPVAQTPVLEESKRKDNIFTDYGVNPFVSTKKDVLSTFGLDVDTASYTWMRKSIMSGLMVSKDSVRPEEYINYFDYNYNKPESDNKFAISTELSKVKDTNVLRVGLKAFEIDNKQRKNAHLSLVIDISGSMNQENRLALVKESLKILVNSLNENDYISITVFGDQARNLLNHSNDKTKIINIIDSLATEGATNTESGLTLGYTIAKQNYKTGYINKVILCSDGFANVGSTTPDALLEKIRQDALSGISLSTMGFGMGNYNDVLMEQLADKGDGSYAYVDTLKEAERIFTQNLTGTIQTVAKDAKIQVNFNPEVVSEYRLIGYENRDIADNDFRNDSVDSGDVGSGQSVTALYELKFIENANKDLNLATVYLRYKDVDQNLSVREINKSVKLNDLKLFEQSSDDIKKALSAAVYAEILKGSYWNQLFSLDNVIYYLSQIDSKDEKIKDFINIVNKSKTLR